MIVICVYVPEDKLQAVSEAMFIAGAGQIGNYAKCCFFSLGTGQFLPLDQSTPYLGQSLQVNQVSEWRLEVMVDEKNYKQVMQAMIKAHPYEEPAWHAYRSLGLDD